ncbi:CHAT domain-containing protein [Pedobacter changchengzhani]|uniref:CHAT domain-containing protein n=1 Tax=Pedobacter changchengzhani TaxID=2529274 RepID=A0A4R5MMD1_9SPHI|nr:CHAT domain-containing protein [Pedobacter changchengzhani]TDG36676.1 CHAT domain-containing protein [Pedobacter changchengzhani]
MRLSLAFRLFITLICFANLLFAQDEAFNRKQEALKSANNLSEWIYERLDYVSQNPQQSILLQSTPKDAWRKPLSSLEKQAWLDYLNTCGYYELQEGNILEAINSYEVALSYYEKNIEALKNYEIIEYTLKPLSNSYTRLGDYESALYLQKKSVDILTKAGRNQELPAIFGNMAISYRSMGNLPEAEKSILSALKIASAINPSILLLNNIYADVLFDQNKFAEAKKLIDQNISKHKNINPENAYWVMSAYATAGNIELKLGNYATAEKQFNLSLSTLNKYFKGLRIREKANIFTQLGKIKFLQQKPLLALNHFQSSLKTLKIIGNNNQIDASKIYGENKIMEVFEQIATVQLALQQPDEAFKNIQLALITADKIRSEFDDDKTKQRLQADTKSIAERGIEISYNQYLKTKQQKYLIDILNLSEQSKSRTLLDQIQRNQKLLAITNKDSLFIKKQALERAIIFNERQEIERRTTSKKMDALKFDLALINKQIKEKYRQFNTSTYSKPIAEEIDKLPNTRFITYFFGKEAIYILNIKNKKILQVEKLAHATDIKLSVENFSNTYFQHGPNAMMNDPKLFFEASNHVYKTLLGNILFTPNEKIIIVPDGVLAFISFDGLITNSKYTANISSWPFLIKSNIISYAFSLKTLVSNKASSKSNNFAGLFITHQKLNNQPLLAVQEEADKIKQIVGGNFLFNDEVNHNSFINAFENSKVLHIGTHAYLSGENAEPTLDFEKEKIYLFELSSQKTAPSLVVLSACRTADGALANGEGVISLSRGFNAIGTPATIAGLWNVNDHAASIITANFYKFLLNDKSGSEALNLAKKDWLNQPKSTDAMYLPYYWDSLIYMGLDQNINLKASTNWKLINGILVAISILGCSIIWFLNRKRFNKNK